jgi:hypothetical protein
VGGVPKDAVDPQRASAQSTSLFAAIRRLRGLTYADRASAIMEISHERLTTL